MGAIRRPIKRALVGLTIALVGAGGFLAAGAAQAAADVAPVAQRSSTAVTSDALPTVQINGVVWDQVIVGDTVYAGGEFTSARPAGSPAGTNETPRSNLLAYNIKTGALITTFAPTVNAQVKSLAVSPDGTKLYIAGSFTSVNGSNRYRMASFTVATGALTSFAPAPNSTVNSVEVTDTAVYAGGVFSKVGSITRSRLAAFNPTSGALLGWAPVADATVQAVLPTPDKSRVIVAGSFANLNGSTATGLGSIDATTGATLRWTANTVVRNYGTQAAMLKLRTDGTTVYAVGYWFGGPQGNFEGVLAADANSGDVKWLADCHGDTYDVTPMNGIVYAVSHWHYCSNIGGFPDTNPRKIWYRGNAMTKAAEGTVAHNGQGGYTDFFGKPAPAMVNWFPTIDSGTYTGQSQGAWSAASNSQYLVLGGEFPAVNGTKQQGLVRFAVPSQAPKQQGPREAGAAFNPTVLAMRPDQARIKWTANYDRDDQTLTYSLTRIGTALPIYTTTVTNQFWNRPGLSFTDTGLTPGQTYKYRVSAADPDGNTVSSEIIPITMPVAEDPYVTQVLADGAADYWRMNGTGGTQPDYAGAFDLTNDTGTATAPSGALTTADAALNFNGSGTGQAGTTNAAPSANTFSAEAWFKTTTTSGGKILGFGGSSTGNSGSYDRHVYMDNSGKVLFGVYPGSVQTVSGSKAYNDGQWHHAVAELSGAGMVLYMDGIKVASNPSITTGQDYAGYWRVGGDNINGWTNQPSSFYFNGTIDEVAIYPNALTSAQVRDHYTNSGRTAAGPTPNKPPVASFTSSCAERVCSFDGSGSSDPDGTVTGYAWDFKDGGTSTSATPSHTFAADGTYAVTLTVTDNGGDTTTLTKNVVVAANPANVKPTAAFTKSCTNLVCSFDGSTSTDSDGTVAGYAWDFGDNTAAGSGKATDHTYAAAGTYAVKLTVTDNQGATDSTTSSVTVSAAQAGPIAADNFGRSVSRWGNADTGGAWTYSGSTFATNGSTGNVTLAGPGVGATGYLNSVNARDLDVVADFSMDKVATGSGTYNTMVVRRNGSSDYRATFQELTGGKIKLTIAKTVNGSAMNLQQVALTDLTYSAGDKIRVRFQVSGNGTSDLELKAWKVGSGEPATSQISATDSTSSLQTAGSFAIVYYLAGSATNAPVTTSVDNLLLTAK